MIQCDDVVGKSVRTLSLYEDGPHGPEINIEFTDGTAFNVCLRTSQLIEAKLFRDHGEGSEVLQDFSTPVKP